MSKEIQKVKTGGDGTLKLITLGTIDTARDNGIKFTENGKSTTIKYGSTSERDKAFDKMTENLSKK